MTSKLSEALEAAEAENNQQPGKPCPACQAVAAQTDQDDQATLIRALNGTIGTRKLSLLLRGWGFTVSREAITLHRNERHQA